MQEQSIPPADTPTEKVPLEERGHLSRTQLYMVAAFLSISVLGLVGYIAWYYYQTSSKECDTETNAGNTTVADTTTDEDNTEDVTVTDVEIEEPCEEPTLETLSGNISRRYMEGGKYYIDFVDFSDCEVGSMGIMDCSSAEATSYEIVEESLILLYVCGDGAAGEWKLYSQSEFVAFSDVSLNPCFGEGANGFQVSVVNDSLAVFVKNGVSVP